MRCCTSCLQHNSMNIARQAPVGGCGLMHSGLQLVSSRQPSKDGHSFKAYNQVRIYFPAIPPPSDTTDLLHSPESIE